MEKNAYSVSCQLVSTHAKLNVLTKWLKKKNIMMSEIVEQEITNLQVLLIDQLMLAFCPFFLPVLRLMLTESPFFQVWDESFP